MLFLINIISVAQWQRQYVMNGTKSLGWRTRFERRGPINPYGLRSGWSLKWEVDSIDLIRLSVQLRDRLTAPVIWRTDQRCVEQTMGGVTTDDIKSDWDSITGRFRAPRSCLRRPSLGMAEDKLAQACTHGLAVEFWRNCLHLPGLAPPDSVDCKCRLMLLKTNLLGYRVRLI